MVCNEINLGNQVLPMPCNVSYVKQMGQQSFLRSTSLGVRQEMMVGLQAVCDLDGSDVLPQGTS